MSGYFEGDMVRPLGVVTFTFGYVEAEVNNLILILSKAGVPVEVAAAAPLGQRLAGFTKAIQGLQVPVAAEVLAILAESGALLDKRNSLIHAGIFAEGRVVPNDPAVEPYTITPEFLTALAEEAFNWKERLNAAIQMRLLPALGAKGQ